MNVKDNLPQRGRRTLIAACIVLLCLLVTVTWAIVNTSQNKLIEFKSRQIANVVALQAKTARSIYSSTVVAKLKRDGFPASTDFESQIGSVPIPAQFLKSLAHDSNKQSDGSYQFRPLSKWNLNPDQGLKDEFQRWAWEELEAQERAGRLSPGDWKPVWQFAEIDGRKALRYMVADPASSQSCVDCHNVMEKTSEILALRTDAGISSEKIWALNDLMGALEVIVPVHESSELASSQTRNGLLLILAVSLVGILLVLAVSAIDRARTINLTRNLEYQARHDVLTTLPNRVGFDFLASEIINSDHRDAQQHAIMLLDLNDFKRINDTLGHQMGDEVLKKAASKLVEILPDDHVIARLGGDEFAICLPRHDKELAKKKARLIAKELDAVIEVGEYRLHSPASIGVAGFPQNGDSLVELLRCADVAMYIAKRDKSDFAFYEAKHDNNHLNTLSVISDFKSALSEGGLSLVYQPKFDLAAGKICGVEALLRWKHDEFGMIPPVKIIPMAEQTGQIGKLTQWTLDTGLEQLRQWRGQGHDLNLAVNLSAEMLDSIDVVSMILNSLKQAGVPESSLIVEITETAMMTDPETALDIVSQLAGAGVVISLDDFGTGYSSLSQVHKLQLDELKLDRSFLADEDNDRNKAIIKTAIELANNLGLNLVAEGVEDAHTLSLLLEMNCTLIQGYYLCKPIAASALSQQFGQLNQLAAEWAAWVEGAEWPVSSAIEVDSHAA